jgi:hypothetical protein
MSQSNTLPTPAIRSSVLAVPNLATAITQTTCSTKSLEILIFGGVR